MKRSILLAVTTLALAMALAAGQAQAQTPLYLTGGLTMANVSGDDLGDTESKTGFFVAAGTAIPLNERFMIEGHVAYVQKGAAEEGGDGELGLDYIEIPIFLSTTLPLTETVGLGLSAGPEISFNISCDFDGEDCSDDDDLNTIDFGIIASAGITFPVTETVGMVVGVGADFGLAKIADDEDVKNRVYYLFAGVGIPLGGG